MKENYRAWTIDVNVPRGEPARPESVEWVEPFPKDGSFVDEIK